MDGRQHEEIYRDGTAGTGAARDGAAEASEKQAESHVTDDTDTARTPGEAAGKDTAENGQAAAARGAAGNGRSAAEKDAAESGQRTAEKDAAGSGQSTAEKDASENGQTAAEQAAAENGQTAAGKAAAGESPEAGADPSQAAGDADESADGASDGEPKQGSDGKWHVFGRKKDKKDAKDEKIEELTDKLRRQMAEFDNFRKRTEKEKSAMFEIGAKDIIERVLPVIDNFERGLAAMPEDIKGTPFADGMEMIYKQLLKNLEDAGLKPIEAVGQPFDPAFHNAVMHVEDENLGENVVAQEFQKGYMYRDAVVRHSMVQVAN